MSGSNPKPRSEESRQRQAEAMRRYWAGLSEIERSNLAKKVGDVHRGKVVAPETRRKLSEARKTQVFSEETRRKLSESGKLAYAEGRKQPVRSSHNLGKVMTGEQRDKNRVSLLKTYETNPCPKGYTTGPRSQEIRDKISKTTKGRPGHIPLEKKDSWKARISASKMGVLQSKETCVKRSASLRLAYAEGRKVVSAKSGYGIGSYYQTPTQGEVWLRSSSEVQRARELDAEGVLWFYEAKRYPVLVNGVRTTYTPDFWIVPGRLRGESITDPALFLSGLSDSEIQLEDVKGWWGPKHKTYLKIQAFQDQYPQVLFQIVVRRGLK